MKPSIIAVVASGFLGLAFTTPKPAQAAQVFVDFHIGVPAVVTPPSHIVYEPVVVYRPRVVTPPPVVYYPRHYYHPYRGAVVHHGYGHEIRRIEGPIIEQRWAR